MAMKIHEVDEPFDLPDDPEYSSMEENRLSLIGRVLNPDRQNISDLVLDMPRKWQLYDKVRGVALSSERFQFIFKEEKDLEEILDRGVQTYNQWALVIERWVEVPPTGFLQSIPVWVQLRNIPINHRTIRSITDLGGFAGKVIEVAYDPLKAQSREYVRVRVNLDVSNPVRRAKVVNLPSGRQTTVLYDFERLQKRCYTCQRLTHEQEKCPLFLNKDSSTPSTEKENRKTVPEIKAPFLKKDDPLFGILSEDQVGINPSTGRPRINPEVLEGMRIYLMVASGSDRIVREGRVRSSIEALKNDPRGQTILTLEPCPIISSDIDKGKGIVYSYEQKEKGKHNSMLEVNREKLMKEAIHSGLANSRLPLLEGCQSEGEVVRRRDRDSPFISSPTGYRIGYSEAGSSGTAMKKKKPRKRPHMSNRKLRGSAAVTLAITEEKKKGLVVGIQEKRKALGEAGDKELEAHIHKQMIFTKEDDEIKIANSSNQEMVPNEGPSNI